MWLNRPNTKYREGLNKTTIFKDIYYIMGTQTVNLHFGLLIWCLHHIATTFPQDKESNCP